MVTAIGTCARCESPIERGDLRCAICSLAVAFDEKERERIEVQVLRCQGCGAAVDYDAQAQAPRCAFCDSVMQLEHILDPVEQTELYLPFTVDREEARRAVKTWLGSLGWFRPADLKKKARVEDIRPLWWVAWVFDAEALVSWAADSNQDAWRSSWAPHAGQVNLRFDDIVVSASRGLSDEEVDAMVPRYKLGGGQPSVEPPAGTTSEQFDVQRSQARQRVANAVTHMAGRIVEAQHIPGTSTRKVKVVPLVSELVTRRYSLPAWVMAYRYKGQVYRAVVCGQDRSTVLGKAPYSLARILLAAGFGVLLLLLVLLIAVATLG